MNEESVLTCSIEVGLKVHSAVVKLLISRKNQKARLTLAEDHVVWRENWSKVHLMSLIYLGMIGNILFGVKLGKN